ncbi:MAG: hypothetical protein ACI4V7_00950 [Succinivibrionaceae bacterium]
MIKNICKNCGKEYEYEPKKGTYKFQYCSIECRNEFNKKDKEPQFRICEHCGKEYWWDGSVLFYGEQGNKVDTKKFCCYECGTIHKYNKVKKTTIEHFGAIGWGSKEVLAKCQKTSKERYGTINNYQKIKESNLEKYGTEFISQAFNEKISKSLQKTHKERGEEIREKIIKTNLEKYGTKTPFEAEIVKEKAKQTSLKKYGVENPNQSEIVKEKIKETNLKRYGTPVASQAETIKAKIKHTHSLKTKEEREEILQKSIKTSLKQYKTAFPSQNKEVRKKVEKTNLKKYGKTTNFDYEQIKHTNLEKYGVEYTCLLDSCQNSNPYLISKLNIKFSETLTQNGLSNELEFKLGNYSFDIKTGKVLIELDPTFTHSSTKIVYKGNKKILPKAFDYHYNKSKVSKENGYRCIHIWDWDDKDKIINLLKPKTTLYARQLEVKEVSFEDTGTFLNQYHIQNSCSGQDIRLGLYKDDELVEMMTFGKPRYNKKYEYELLRLCTKDEYKVVGGAEKLFKFFVNKYKPSSIVSYCDNSKFTGEVYTRLGMELKSYGKPTKHWYNVKTGRHFTDNLVRQRGYSQLHNDKLHTKGESNDQLMLEAGYLEIYDCGQSTYIWKL